MISQWERNWAVAAHLTSFVAAYVALGFLGPLVVLLVQGDKSPYVRAHAVEALNFNLTWLIYILVSAVLVVVLVGLALLVVVLVGLALLAVVGLAYAVLVVLGAVAAADGRTYRYPLTIRFIS